MSKLERAYVTSNDVTFKKVIDKNGITRHFKDGTPITENSFNGGLAHRTEEGQRANVAIPSNKGPGYERIEVSQQEASQLGQELRLMRKDVPGTPKDKVTLNGKQYDTYALQKLNDKIIERHGQDAVFKY
ncbi:MAG: hypothetical protein ACOCT9_00955 [archaeon]